MPLKMSGEDGQVRFELLISAMASTRVIRGLRRYPLQRHSIQARGYSGNSAEALDRSHQWPSKGQFAVEPRSVIKRRVDLGQAGMIYPSFLLLSVKLTVPFATKTIPSLSLPKAP